MCVFVRSDISAEEKSRFNELCEVSTSTCPFLLIASYTEFERQPEMEIFSGGRDAEGVEEVELGGMGMALDGGAVPPPQRIFRISSLHRLHFRAF